MLCLPEAGVDDLVALHQDRRGPDPLQGGAACEVFLQSRQSFHRAHERLNVWVFREDFGVEIRGDLEVVEQRKVAKNRRFAEEEGTIGEGGQASGEVGQTGPKCFLEGSDLGGEALSPEEVRTGVRQDEELAGVVAQRIRLLERSARRPRRLL